MRYLIWYFIKFLWDRSSINAFTVCIWIDKYMDSKTQRQLADCLLIQSRMEKQ